LKKSLIFILIGLMLAFGAAFVACGGGDDKDKGGLINVEQQDNQDNQDNQDSQDSQDTPAAKATKKPSSGGDSSASLGDVPIYPGAKKITSGEFSGSDAAIPGIGSGVDAADYQNVEYAMYETDDSPEDVYDWYKDNMDGWDETGSFSGGSGEDFGAYAYWTKDDGKTAAWISVSQSDGTTSLGVWVASE